MDVQMQTPTNTLDTRFPISISENMQIPRTTTLPNLRFWKYETKLIIFAGFSTIISVGCIGIVFYNPNNCALNSCAFSLLSAITGIFAGLLTSNSNNCFQRRDSCI